MTKSKFQHQHEIKEISMSSAYIEEDEHKEKMLVNMESNEKSISVMTSNLYSKSGSRLGATNNIPKSDTITSNLYSQTIKENSDSEISSSQMENVPSGYS